MKTRIFLAFVLISPSLFACTPMPVLAMFSGAVGMQTTLLPKDVAGLFFPIAVLLKSGVFAFICRKYFFKSFLAMLSGNVVSTIPGILMGGMMAGGPSTGLFALILMLPLGYYIGKNINNYSGYNYSPFAIAFLTPIVAIISIIFFFLGTGAEFDILGIPLNFGFSVLASIGAVILSLSISTVFEWAICHRFLKENFSVKRTGKAAIIANLSILFLLSTTAAYLYLAR